MPGSERHIAHIDMDNFFVSIEQLRNSALKGKPVLIGGSNDRGIVAACSEEARQFGIHTAMPMRVAQRLCKYATIIKADFEAYSKFSHVVTEILKSEVPLLEKSNVDEYYIDLTGMDKFFGCKKFTHELIRKVYKECGLSSSFGLASNKLVSKVAAGEDKPRGQLEIPFGFEKPFLNPLSITKIPGVGEQTAFKLMKMGVETIKVLSEVPATILCDVLGKVGHELWRRANGIDESPVVPYQEEKSISKEHVFQQDTIDMQLLTAELVRMTESLGFELRTQKRLTGCVVLKLRYSDGDTHTLQRSIAYCNQDQQLIAVAKELFQQLFTRRVLVRMIGIRFTHLIPGVYQIDLFSDDNETIKLYQQIDSIKKRFGEGSLGRASVI
ncbi:MAG: DNA polymerase IV [Chitinophagaceae bacterium]|nr:DNA polymerase IV [Chitinophagaceae bacterium]